jgi:hypothetical protein
VSESQKHLIIWQKWADPFGDDDSPDLLGDSISDIEEDEYNNYEDADIEKKKSKESGLDMEFSSYRKNIRVMATPMGIIPLTENTASSKIFNFWVGHTNFSITRNIALIIEEISGVEALDVFTRYRFRIAIGKAFKDSNVIQKINDKIYEYLE